MMGGVWQISITNSIVTLVFVQEIELNSRVQVLFGATYATAVLYYNATIPPGQSVPYYAIYRVTPKSTDITRTTFNNNSTRFFSYRDQYYTPGSQDQYLKFPQDGTFK